MKIFVYGATGTVSGFLLDRLLAAGHEVYAGSRKPESGRKADRLHWVPADASKPSLGLDVLDKVDRAFFLAPPGFTDHYSLLHPWLEKAISRKLDRFLLMTAMGIGQAPPEVPFRKLEIELQGSGLDFNIIRPNWFMQNFNTFWISGIRKDHKIYFPGGDAKTSFIDARDIASVAQSLITSDSHHREVFDITGPEALTHGEVAAKLSKVVGFDISYVDVTPEDFQKGLVGAGVPADYAGFLVVIAASLKAGHSAPVLDTVKLLTGKDPTSFDQYARDYRSNWI